MKRNSKKTHPTPLAASFYDRPVVDVARDLLGVQLFRQTADGLCVGRIVEVEAYLASGDSACHAARGKSKKNVSMFGPPGRAYVYAIHSRWCLNVVTEPCDTPSAVLIRAVEPLVGEPLMQARRGVEKVLDLARGPGRLCEAFAIRRELDGWDLTLGHDLWLARTSETASESESIGVSPRIGVTSAQEKLLRYFYRGNRFVSGPRHWHASS